MTNLFKERYSQKILLGLLLVVILTYANAMRGGFMFDDHAYFDDKIKKLDIGFQFVLDYTPDKDMVGARTAMWYRPLANVLLMVEYFLFGQQTFFYHAFSIILWALAAFSIFYLIRSLFDDEKLAMLTAFFYVVHPINGIVVNYITASVYSLQVILTSLAILFFMEKIKIKSIPGVYISIIFFFLALMVHETAFLIPVFIAISLLIKQKDIRAIWPLFLVGGIYFIWRLFYASLTQFSVSKWSLFDMNFFEYTATLIKLFCWYVQHLFSPMGTVVLHSMEVERSHVLGWNVIGAAIAMGCFYLMSKARQYPWLWGIWFFITGFLILPAAALLQPKNGMMIEPHWFVFSSCGFFCVLAGIILRLQRWRYWAIGAVMILWMINGWGLNYLWANEKRYGAYWHQQSPAFLTLAYHMGRIHENDKELKEARYYYTFALKHQYRPERILPAIGWMDIQEKKWELALWHLIPAAQLNPKDERVWTNLGVAFEKNNRIQDAINSYTVALKSNPNFLPAQKNLQRLKKGKDMPHS